MGRTLVIGSEGYIGSRLTEVLGADGIDDRFSFTDYSDAIDGYEVIVLLAGVSSVAMSNRLPNLAWKDNVEYFKRLLNKLTNRQKLIYASSASVYNGIPNTAREDTSTFNLQGMYDLTKYTIDQLALLSGKHVYGLRFATVNGYSPNLRVDVMLNKMVADAKETGVVKVANSNLSRPILSLEDLCRAVRVINDSTRNYSGIYNLASFAATVGDMAEAVADRYGAKVETLPDTPHYVFDIDTTKFKGQYRFEFHDTLEDVLDGLDRPWEATCIRD